MRRFRDPSHLCRAGSGPGPTPRSITVQRRTIFEKYPRGVIIQRESEPTKKNFPSFELPKVVLDLDAENIPHVRPLNNRDIRHQKAKWGYSPVGEEVMLRATNLRKEMARDEKKMRHQASKLNNMQTISDYNVFAIALLGGSSVSSSLKDLEPRDEQQRPITLGGLRANGIPERILAGDANKVISFMLHRQELAREQEDAGDLEAFKTALSHCKNLGQLRRLCLRGVDAAPQQKEIVHASSGHIVHSLRSMPPQPLKEILKFVNNFTIRQLAENAGLSAAMPLYGLEIASKLELLPAIVQYLQICLSQAFIGNDNTDRAILGIVGLGTLTALERGQGTARGTRPELFTLLTGRSLVSSEPQPALYGLDVLQGQGDPEVHCLYTRLLAELGAFRLLWHSRRGAQEATDTTAFIRCAQVLGSAEGDAGVDYSTVTGELETDADLDLRDISRLDAYHTSVASKRAPYSSNIEGRISPDELKEAFESADIHGAMARLQELMSRAPAATQTEPIDIENSSIPSDL
ncbi:hypothetical protein VPNG_00896 [Cytospora leucostoma]|uniref:Uncharacterized protein n=1 Tax=Cytospora leucostoma TaxID=1230097 RepID=A0A423XLW4_9PEZI|nr:hypothetical protein VPNG_00896 [Cytospora leucostoma]